MENPDRSPVQPQTSSKPPLRPYPSKLFVEVTTRCNLHCSMCVKEAEGQCITEGDMPPELFARLAPAMPRLDTLILNGIGEPLLHRHLEQFIRDAKNAMPTSGQIGFQTNGQLLTRQRAFSLVEAGIDRVCMSADAVCAETFGAIRGGARPEKIERAAAALHEAGRARGRAVSLGVEFVAMKDNVAQLPDLVRWAAKNHFSFIIVTHMLAYHKEMASAAAFVPVTDLSQQVHRYWRERVAAEGVDLRDSIILFTMLGSRSESNRRRIEYIAKMTAEASQQDVSLNHDRLMNWDETPIQRTRDAFDAAAEVARQEGIDLRLPAVVPTRNRRCDFVEDGGCFVSWDGNIHPCYSLWHRYASHIGGYEQQVAPVSFGNLAEQDVLSIWNGDVARTFRENVLKYDYPFCYDCNVALCNYMQDEEFIGDCYLSTVPCGGCLWSTGIFQCLR